MITLKQAYEIAMGKIGFSEFLLYGIDEYPDVWVFPYCFRKDGGAVIVGYETAVDKKTGKIQYKFPFEFEGRKTPVPLSELEKLMPPEDFALMKKYREEDEDEEFDD